MYKPMLPTLSEDVPKGKDWVYEVKYDGFRCLLEWTEKGFRLISRNGKDLTAAFPEIKDWAQSYIEKAKKHFPLLLDGELVILNTSIQTNFFLLQTRSRVKTEARIKDVQSRPATFMAFDIVQFEGADFCQRTFFERRKKLEELFKELGWNDFHFSNRINLVEAWKSLSELWEKLYIHRGEGIVAKRTQSFYEDGKRSRQWLKIKNWKTVTGFLQAWDENNGYYALGLTNRTSLGRVKHGFSSEEVSTLSAFIKDKGKKAATGIWTIPPAIPMDVHCLGATPGELREPIFDRFRFDVDVEECTTERVNYGLAQMPLEVEVTNPDKELFPRATKQDLLVYLRVMAPFLLERLNKKPLTLIRYPDGIHQQSFYQKHLPDYAPEFVKGWKLEGEEEFFIGCENLASLIWLGNQGTIEYHVPFQRLGEEMPDEIVFDLDPPSVEKFQIAVFAAQLIHEMTEGMGYYSFAKTSGRKGLQVHIPLKNQPMTFDETREFTEAVANVIVDKHPEYFTIERMKKNRGERVYIDYIQHAAGKTIIAPYSPRASEHATVATPLFWEEVNENLDPTQFTIFNVPQRVEEKGCPMLLTWD
ncbi:DNA ligase D [Bacillaceae bacterium S4-13-56]